MAMTPGFSRTRYFFFVLLLLFFFRVELSLANTTETLAGQGNESSAGGRPFEEPPVQGRNETLLREKISVVQVALNRETVKCSHADYSQPMLKVLVPALADLTLLNHRNTSEGAPCVAAGPCRSRNGSPAASPNDVLKGGDRNATITVRVVLKRVTERDETAKVCRVYVKEQVYTNIAGIPFYHEKVGPLSDRVLDDCP